MPTPIAGSCGSGCGINKRGCCGYCWGGAGASITGGSGCTALDMCPPGGLVAESTSNCCTNNCFFRAQSFSFSTYFATCRANATDSVRRRERTARKACGTYPLQTRNLLLDQIAAHRTVHAIQRKGTLIPHEIRSLSLSLVSPVPLHLSHGGVIFRLELVCKELERERPASAAGVPRQKAQLQNRS